jgi:hypothetical protein
LADDALRVLVLAPFERGRSQGGSQRATAIAERLEERGIEVGWLVVRRPPATRTGKLRSLAAARPNLPDQYEPPAALPSGRWDAALVAHSCLMRAVGPCLGSLPTLVDFHNLEWQVLADVRASDRSAARRVLRAGYARGQIGLMRRAERAIVRSAQMSLFVAEPDRRWATAVAPRAATMLVRSVLPRDQERAAVRIRSRRDPVPGRLAYVGTLTFPTNAESLERFLARDWPAMRAAVPGLQLDVAGACAPELRAALDGHPGVRALGFVDDLTPVLARCQAVVMPFDGAAGTSLRALFYALAGLPVIGSPQAFRGIGFPVGATADSPAAWARAAGQIGAMAGDGLQAASAHQREAAPWDRLADAIRGLTGAAGTPAPVPATTPPATAEREVRV